MSEEEAGLSRTQRILRAIEPLIYARRALTMAVLVLITVLLFWQMLQIRRDAGFDKSIPLGHEYMKVLKQYMSQDPDRAVVIVADREAQIAKAVDVLDECNLANVKKVSISSLKE